MERYEVYKDSYAPWLGKIPIHWGERRIKTVAHRTTVAGHPDEVVLSLYRDYGVVVKDERDDNFNRTSEDTSTYKYVEIGDLVVNKMKAWQGSLAISDYQGIVSPAYHIYKIIDENMHLKYLHYLLRDKSYLPEYRRLSGGIRIGQWDLSAENFLNIPLLVPPLDEQQAIANWLDEKTAEIDGLVGDCEREIELLQEYRKSVISEAVTKGLDPDAPVKDSGVEWIGEIPEGWSVAPYKAVAKVVANLVHPSEYLEYMQVSPENIEKDTGRLFPCNCVAVNAIESDNHLFAKGDILYSKVRPALNKVTIAPFDGLCSADMYPITTTQNKHWLVYFMLSNEFVEQVVVSTNRVKMPKLNKEELGCMKVILPDRKTQEGIVDYLDAKTAEIDGLIEARQAMVEKLKEYRKSIISEAVTGKFKVPGVGAHA